jgi:hypothetical protein
MCENPLPAACFDLFKHKVRESPADIDTNTYHPTPRCLASRN